MPTPVEPPSDQFFEEQIINEQIVNAVAPNDAFGATPRWVPPDQEPVSRFEAGGTR